MWKWIKEIFHNYRSRRMWKRFNFKKFEDHRLCATCRLRIPREKGGWNCSVDMVECYPFGYCHDYRKCNKRFLRNTGAIK